MPEDILKKIIDKKRGRLDASKAARGIDDVRRDALAAREGARPHALREALSEAGRVNVIAEFKRASPSKGLISGAASVRETVTAYERGGAAALSVLTEEDFFRGSLEDLREAKRCAGLPALRKDFVFDEYQVYETAAAGADALLLIVAALDDDALARLRALAEETLGLDALVEVHTEDEMRRAARAGARLVGVNNRDLRTFDVTLETSLALAPLAPEGSILVSESGIASPSDIALLRACGFKAFLVGETLMRAGSPEEALRALVGYEKGRAGGWFRRG